MATILIYTSPGQGHLYPIVDIALALKARGHELRVRTLSSGVERMQALGIPAETIAPAIEAREVDDWKARATLESVRLGLGTFIDRAPHEVDDQRHAIDRERPDLLLIDTNCWGAQAVAESTGLPWATWHPFPMPLPSKDAPPFGPGFPPARGPLGRLRDALIRPLAIGPLQRQVPRLNRVRVAVGARPFDHITELYRTPPLVLLMTAEPFEYPRSDWPSNMALVGPGLWCPPSTEPSWLAGIDKPVVLVTCSTEYQNDGALLEAAIAAFGQDASVQLVCTTAGVDPSTVRAPPGVIVERFVPHAQVLPKCAAVVCHGGMGITQRALASGVPVCAVPWGRDQSEVGRRVEEAEAGVLLARARLTPARLLDAVTRARARAAGAARVRDAFRAAGGAPRAAALVEALLGDKARRAA